MERKTMNKHFTVILKKFTFTLLPNSEVFQRQMRKSPKFPETMIKYKLKL